MSHDIRTPMNAIMGMTALAVARLDDQDRVADCLQKISLSSKHLLSLINDVLDMSKIERSMISFNRMRVSLSQLLEQLSSIMGPQAKAAGLQLRICKDEIRRESFYGDALRINQILINLLSNAVKFTPEGGSIDFQIKEMPPVLDPAHIRYQFTVRDTGIGMSEELLVHIFEPFTRSSAAAGIEGTGLGLSITKGLVDLMRGEISVDSKLGRGTRFCVELEFEAAPEEEAANTRTSFAELSSVKMEKIFTGSYFLIAEDNAINAEILSELLKLFGAESIVKTDGLQAVQAFRNAAPGTFDAVLMDIQMPEMNGFEATRAIREMERPDAKEIPIVAMTANAFAEDIQASRDAGMTAHVAKPIDIDVLRDTIRMVLKKNSKIAKPETIKECHV